MFSKNPNEQLFSGYFSFLDGLPEFSWIREHSLDRRRRYLNIRFPDNKFDDYAILRVEKKSPDHLICFFGGHLHFESNVTVQGEGSCDWALNFKVSSTWCIGWLFHEKCNCYKMLRFYRVTYNTDCKTCNSPKVNIFTYT